MKTNKSPKKTGTDLDKYFEEMYKHSEVFARFVDGKASDAVRERFMEMQMCITVHRRKVSLKFSIPTSGDASSAWFQKFMPIMDILGPGSGYETTDPFITYFDDKYFSPESGTNKWELYVKTLKCLYESAKKL